MCPSLPLSSPSPPSLLFFFHAPATTEIYTLSLHDALPIWRRARSTISPTAARFRVWHPAPHARASLDAKPETARSEEHTSELQSRRDLVCRLLLEKKKKKKR